MTSSGGEIVVLDSGGYGKVTITQSVSIIAPPGVYGGISVFAPDDGVTVAAGASDKVTLRGLTINGQGGSRGVVVTSGGEINIEQCTVANMGSHGIQIDGGSRTHIRGSVVRSNADSGLYVAGGTPEVHMVDSQFSRNMNSGIFAQTGKLVATRIVANGNALHGVAAIPPSLTSVYFTLTDSTVSENGDAVVVDPELAGSYVEMEIVRSTISHNGSGIFVYTINTGIGRLILSDSAVLSNQGDGMFVGALNATAIVTRSTVAGNSGFDLNQVSGAILLSSGNNTLTGRGAADISGTITSNPLK